MSVTLFTAGVHNHVKNT